MIAKFPGTCKVCGNRIASGTDVVWKRGDGIRHQPGQCPPAVAPSASSAAAPKLQLEDAGVYVMADGSIVKVKANRAKTNVYAMRWQEIHGQRSLEAGGRVHGEYAYQPGLVKQVAVEGRKMTLDEAKAFIIQFGQCARCGKFLKDAKSVERGIGPVCVKYFEAGTTGAQLLTGAAA